jgi:hypothetical protein
MEGRTKVGVVRRVSEIHASSMEAVERTVRALTFDQAVDRAGRASEERELMAEAFGPVFRMIGSDEAAAAAMNKLAKARRAGFSEVISGERRHLSPGGSAEDSSRLDLQPGTSAFSAPYDGKFMHEEGDPAPTAEADADHGLLTLEIPYNGDSHGVRAASAGVSIVLEASKQGTIEVRPWIECDFEFATSANALSAHTEGRIDMTVVDDGGASLPGSQAPLWNIMTEDSVSGTGAGIIRSPQRDVSFPARPGTQYTLSITATIAGDQSGHGITIWPAFESYSYFYGRLTVSIPWLTVELRS